jgi:uncharacterized surface protein with fasciclin (FAS1) repeats
MNESKSASAGQHGSTTHTAATKNVVDTAIAAGNFTTLVAGIKTAGLTDKFTFPDRQCSSICSSVFPLVSGTSR